MQHMVPFEASQRGEHKYAVKTAHFAPLFEVQKRLWKVFEVAKRLLKRTLPFFSVFKSSRNGRTWLGYSQPSATIPRIPALMRLPDTLIFTHFLHTSFFTDFQNSIKSTIFNHQTTIIIISTPTNPPLVTTLSSPESYLAIYRRWVAWGLWAINSAALWWRRVHPATLPDERLCTVTTNNNTAHTMELRHFLSAKEMRVVSDSRVAFSSNHYPGPWDCRCHDIASIILHCLVVGFELLPSNPGEEGQKRQLPGGGCLPRFSPRAEAAAVIAHSPHVYYAILRS